jgi:hypothetical protein
MAVYGGPDIVTDGLVLHLDAGNTKSYPGTGNTWFDMSGNENNGTNSNMTYISEANGAFSFNNTSSVSTIPNSSSLNPTIGLTIEAWVKFDGNDADFIFEKGNVNTQYSLFSHGGTLNDLRFRTYHVGYGSYSDLSVNKTTVGISTGNWYHCVGSWDGSVKKIFLNGALKGQSGMTANLVTTTTGAAVGRFGGTTTGYYFGGDIAKVAIYSIGLNDSQVLNNYNALKGRFNL